MKRQKTYNDEAESRLIAWLRLPLMLLVLFNHTRLLPFVLGQGGVSVVELPLLRTLHMLFTVHLSRLAVPLFFLFSGYLFFRDVEEFSRANYGEKLKRRLRTLLIPYLLWNLLTLLLLAVGDWLLPSLLSGERTPIADYSIGELLSAFWLTSAEGYSPICIPLWYLRDLMVILLLAYPIWELLRRGGYLLPALLGAVWIVLPYNYAPVTGLSLLGLFFFSLGGAFALRGASFVAPSLRGRYWALLLYVVGFLLFLCFRSAIPKPCLSPFFNLMVLSGTLLLVGFSASWLSTHPAGALLRSGGFSFFLYASHYFVLLCLTRLALRLLPSTNDYLLSALYLSLPILTTILLYALYGSLRRFAPSLLALLTGARN